MNRLLTADAVEDRNIVGIHGIEADFNEHDSRRNGTGAVGAEREDASLEQQTAVAVSGRSRRMGAQRESSPEADLGADGLGDGAGLFRSDGGHCVNLSWCRPVRGDSTIIATHSVDRKRRPTASHYRQGAVGIALGESEGELCLGPTKQRRTSDLRREARHRRS